MMMIMMIMMMMMIIIIIIIVIRPKKSDISSTKENIVCSFERLYKPKEFAKNILNAET
jgi:hypothetical protein